jgi:multiple sugar transport system permease protein
VSSLGHAGLAATGRGRRRFVPSPWHLLAVPIALLSAFPFLWMADSSLQRPAEALHYPPVIFSGSFDWHNYTTVLSEAPFGHWFWNTTVVTLAAVAGNLVFCSMAGYAFARIRFFGNRLAFIAILATLMVPLQVVIIPTYIICKDLGLIDSLNALIVPNLATPLGIFMLRQFFLSLPVELEEAARIDGCTRLGVLWRVVLPLARPALITLGVITVTNMWNDFFWPLVAIVSSGNYTLQLGLNALNGAHATEWTILMAGNMMTMLPMLALFFLGQRSFVQSIVTTGFK